LTWREREQRAGIVRGHAGGDEEGDIYEAVDRYSKQGKIA